MSFLNFLEAEQDNVFKKPLTEGPFLNLLKSRCKNSHNLAKILPFFRVDKGPEMMLITPEHREERSKFWVDKFINELPAWKKFPSRVTCVKGHTSFDNLTSQDDAYVIIPFDGARIGVTSRESFYKSFTSFDQFEIDRVDNKSLVTWLERLYEALSQITEKDLSFEEPKTFAQFNKCLSRLDEVIKDKMKLRKQFKEVEKLSLEHTKVVTDLLDRHCSDMKSYMSEKFDPESNGFSCGRIESFSRSPGNYEIWIDSPCLLIKRSKYVELYKNGNI